MSEWDGKERRSNRTDHDLLTTIDANLTNFLNNCEKQCEDNKDHFGKHSKRIGILEKAYWLVLGVVVAAQFALRYL